MAKSTSFVEQMNPAKPGGMVAAGASRSAAVFEMRIKPPSSGLCRFALAWQGPRHCHHQVDLGRVLPRDLDGEIKSRADLALGGVATHVGVDATARQACELGYEPGKWARRHDVHGRRTPRGDFAVYPSAHRPDNR